MSQVTDYIQANRPSCIGLWDFGAPALDGGGHLTVPELLRGNALEAWNGSVGFWTAQQPVGGFTGQTQCAVLASGAAGAVISGGSPGADTFNIGNGATIEIMFALAVATGTQDIWKPHDNTGGMALRTNSGHYECVKSYSAVPLASTAVVDTAFHVLAFENTVPGVWLFFVDGVADASNPGSTSNPNPTAGTDLELAFDVGEGNPIAAGSYAYIAVYDTALTAADLLGNYNAALNGTTTPDATLGAIHPIVRGLVG